MSQSMLRQEVQALGLMIIRRMLQTITQTEKLRQKYGMTIQPTKTVDTSAKTQRSFGSLVRAQLRSPISTFTSLRLPSQNDSQDQSSASLEDEEFFAKTIEKAKTSMNFMRRCQWVVTDSKKFEGLIKRLNYFNSSLYNLLRRTSPMCQHGRMNFCPPVHHMT